MCLCFNCPDPHPGNILVSTNEAQNSNDPSVPVLLDFGLTKRFSPKMLVAFARMMHASYAMDVDELVAAFKVCMAMPIIAVRCCISYKGKPF